MARPDLLPDAVWARLDPAEARVGRFSRRAVVITGLLVVVLATLAVLARTSGVLGDSLGEFGGGGRFVPGSGTFSEEVTVKNNGWFTGRVDAISVTAPAAVLTSQRGQGTAIQPGGTADIAVTVHITDCSRISRRTEIPIALTVHGPFGARTETVGGFDSQGVVWGSCHRRR